MNESWSFLRLLANYDYKAAYVVISGQPSLCSWLILIMTRDCRKGFTIAKLPIEDTGCSVGRLEN